MFQSPCLKKKDSGSSVAVSIFWFLVFLILLQLFYMSDICFYWIPNLMIENTSTGKLCKMSGLLISFFSRILVPQVLAALVTLKWQFSFPCSERQGKARDHVRLTSTQLSFVQDLSLLCHRCCSYYLLPSDSCVLVYLSFYLFLLITGLVQCIPL